MAIDDIPDWDQRLARQDAFWDCAVLDRPVICIKVPSTQRERPYSCKRHATIRERWMDIDYQAELALVDAMNTRCFGDSLPSACPNLGPAVFSAFLGCELEFGEDTSWSSPLLEDGAGVDEIQFNEGNIYWQTIVAMTEAFLEVGRGRFYTGITDLHPGGDAIASLRGAVRLSYDLIERPRWVKDLLRYVTCAYKDVYDFCYAKLCAAKQPITAWAGIVSPRKWYIPSNDYSCMVSPRMFEEVFLDSIVAECRHYEASIYHLDGPGALTHLDTLLELSELNAIQWVHGAGNGRASDWLWVYQRCQAAGKGIQLTVSPEELDFLMQHLKPEGVWLEVVGVEGGSEAESIIRRVSTWV